VRRYVYENLMADIEYARKSFNMNLLYEAHGAIKMAYQLGAITKEEYLQLCHEAIYKGINNPEIIREVNKQCL